MSPRHTDRNPGWQNRKLKAQQKAAQQQAAAKRGQAMTIGKGGITVKDGGTIRAPYPLIGADAIFIGPVSEGDIQAFRVRVADNGGRATFLAETIPDQPAFPGGLSRVSTAADIVSLEATTSLLAWLPATEAGMIVESNYVSLLGAGGVRISHATTGASANTFLDPSDSRIWRSTSSRRYKQDIEDLAVDPVAVLRMRPRSWRDKAQVEADPETETRYVGFIAEELYDVGLGAFVVYDDEDKPEAIAYDRLSAALVALSQQQQRELDNLKQQVGSLEQRLEALESRQH